MMNVDVMFIKKNNMSKLKLARRWIGKTIELNGDKYLVIDIIILSKDQFYSCDNCNAIFTSDFVDGKSNLIAKLKSLKDINKYGTTLKPFAYIKVSSRPKRKLCRNW